MSEGPDIEIIRRRPDEASEKGLVQVFKEEAVHDQAKSARDLFLALTDELEQREEGELKDGLSFLDLKNDILLSYMIDLCNIQLRKLRGQTIEGHASVSRCVEYRVILEKLKATDQKLAYQLNKLIKLNDGDADEGQGIKVQNLDIDLDGLEDDGEEQAENCSNHDGSDLQETEDDEESDEEVSTDMDENEDAMSDESAPKPTFKPKDRRSRGDGHGKDPKSNVYRPPKLRSVAYTEEGESEAGNRGRRKNYDDFYRDEETGEIVEEAHGSRRAERERTKFEEDHYIRLKEDNPRKAKRKLKTKESKKKFGKQFKRRR